MHNNQTFNSLKDFTKKIADIEIKIRPEDYIHITNLYDHKVIEKIEVICNKFHQIVQQMQSRYNNRPTIEIHDEYDVQDLFYYFLNLYFDDIRREENNPSSTDGNAPGDFWLKPEKTIIEIKKTRAGLEDKQLVEELTLDIIKYQAYLDCQTLVCFVYDPEGIIKNREYLERDLAQVAKSIEFKVFIRP